MYFNINFNVFFKLIKVHLLVSKLYIYQNARCNNKKKVDKRVWTQSVETVLRTKFHELKKVGKNFVLRIL